MGTLLRAKPLKGGDAELRDYRNDVAKSAEPPALTRRVDAGGSFLGSS